MKKLKSQPRIKGIVRVPSGESLLPETLAALRKLAFEYGVSVSWVKNTLLNDAVKVKGGLRFDEVVSRRRKR